MTLFAFFYTIKSGLFEGSSLFMRFSGKKLFLIGFIVLLLVGIPVTVYLVQQQQETRTRAEAATSLSFQPDSSGGDPIVAEVGEDIPLDIMIDPGTNLVSFVRLEIQYDPDKVTAADGSFQPNTAVFPTVLSGPVYSAGKVLVSMSVGTDPTKAVQTKIRAGTLTLKSLATTGETTPTIITYSVNTVVTSVGSNDQASENVLAGTIPATIMIVGELTASPTEPVPSTEPTDAPEPTDTPEPTITGSTTPTPTGTASSGLAPVCTALTADTLAGTAPLTVNFTANGTDEDGTITKATFNFGDGQVSDVTTGGGIGTNAVNVPLEHTYTTAGTFQATALLTDDTEGISDTANCTQTVTVNGGSTVATATPTIEPPGSTEVMIGVGAAAVLMLIGGLVFFLF
ncbi:MAG TPA: PKD domain-containing protein [Patescibacteria group bacterium]|nr:PKD domain-containing protein [Patescibacteria group bacterium]